MIYFNYLFLVPISLLLTLIALVLAPILPLFAEDRMGWCDNHRYEAVEPRLPEWMNWFMTPDNSLYGDHTFLTLNGEGYWSKVKWLCRNPAYAFAIRYIDTKTNDTVVVGDDSIKDNDGAKAGWCFVRCAGLFQFTWVNPIGYSRCIYVNFGWNIRGTLHQEKTVSYQATFVFSPRISGFIP